MTPRQIALIQTSFARVAEDAEHATGLFYHRLFSTEPEIKALFHTPVTEQGAHFSVALGAMVDGLDRLDETLPHIAELALRHVDYGVKPEHYAPFCAALIWTLRKGLGEAFDAETEAAWEDALALWSASMIAAGMPGAGSNGRA